MKDRNLVFVYGSLKKGFHNNFFLKFSEFIMKTRTDKKYAMVSFGEYPAVVKDIPNGKIQGEVYSVTDRIFQRIDTLEGQGKFYKRELVHVEGLDVKVWMYFLMHPDDYDYEKDDKAIKRASNEIVWVNR